jgi:DNA-binding SARP family transcriptional activator/tetratricopeptide (TPR) repeat protein
VRGVKVELELLGGFAVRIDGVPAAAFPRRHAAALVKLLALSPGHRLSCERVVDALWPDLLVEEARPRLHKAAHYARRVLGQQDAVVLRGDVVALFPDADVVVDVDTFEAEADAALADGADLAACSRAAALCPGDLLPDDVYEPWTEVAREHVRATRLEVLRGAQRWEQVLAVDPADEEAHLALLRQAVDAGDRAWALRVYARMERSLDDELGIGPGPEATALRERVLAGATPTTGTAAAAVPSWPSGAALLEREAQLRRLQEVLAATSSSGRGAVVLVTGEAGSGKTALVQEILNRVGDRVTTLRGGCDDLLAPRSFGPLRDVAEEIGGDLRDAFAAGGAAEQVLPAVLRLLAREPAVLVLEDVHWADDATLDVVRFLSRRMAGVPSVLVLTYRDDEVAETHPLRHLLGVLPAAVRVPVPPLTVAAVAALAALAGEEVDAGRLHRLTRGNAFCVTEVLAAGGQGVPDSVRDAAVGCLAALSPAGRELVHRLAVVPSRAERRVAEALALGDARAVLEAERAGVLSGDPAFVWFRHELARAAVASTLTAGEQVVAHRAVLDVLLAEEAGAAAPMSPARLVHHAVGGRRSDVLLRLGPGAAEEAARTGAHRQAAETLRAVLEVAGGLGADQEAMLLTRRAYSLYYVNEFSHAWRTATRAVERAEQSGDAVVLADALVALSKAAFWARGPLTARRAAGRAVELLEQVGDDGRLAIALTDLARAHSNLGTPGIVAEPAADAVRFGERALRLAESLGRDDVRCQALFYVGSSRLAEGDERGRADLDQAIALASADPRLELKVRACVNAAGSAYRSGRPADAERYVVLGLRLAEQGEFFGGEFRLRLTSAAVRASTGHWDDAVAQLERLRRLSGDPAAMGQLASALLARLLARRGEGDRAAEVLAAARRLPAAQDVHIGGPLAVAAVELAWLRGEPAAMPALAAPALRAAAEVGHRGVPAELCRYLQRAGHHVQVPPRAPGPWAPALVGRWREAVAGWAVLGERYEQALELALAPDRAAAARGLALLDDLGAGAVVAALPVRVPQPRRPRHAPALS